MLSEECTLEGRDVVSVYTVGPFAVIVNAKRRDRGTVRKWTVVNWVEGWIEDCYADQTVAVAVAEWCAMRWVEVLEVVMV